MQPIPYPLSGPSIKPLSLQFRDKDVMWDSVKCFAHVQIDGRMELHFSSDTAVPAELVRALHGALLSALTGLNLMFHAGAKKFASVTSACFSCSFSLGMRKKVKIRALGGPQRSVTLQCNEKTPCRGPCCSSEAHAWAGCLGLLS